MSRRDLQEVESRVYPSLERKPGKQNWVDKAGGLPSLIERVAKHLHYEKGRPIGVAIATAVNWAKKMCASGTAFGGQVKVKATSQAAACKAVAEWEAKKAKSKAKSVAEAEELTEADVADLRDLLFRRLLVVEDLNHRLNGSGASTGLVESAKELLESDDEGQVVVGGAFVPYGETTEVRRALGHERAELRVLIEGLGGELAEPRKDAVGDVEARLQRAAMRGPRGL